MKLSRRARNRQKEKARRILKRFNVIYCEELVGCVNEKSCTKRSSRTKSLKNALIENYQSRAGKNVEIMSSKVKITSKLRSSARQDESLEEMIFRFF
jgi:hypothetical protein